MILLENQTNYSLKKKRWLKLIRLILEEFGGSSQWWLAVYLVNPQKMARLHQRFLKKRGATTVISLGLPKDFRLGNFSRGGEIYLCPSAIKKSGLAMEYFLVHGLLHLAGFDHQRPSQEKQMLAKEAEICAKIGI